MLLLKTASLLSSVPKFYQNCMKLSIFSVNRNLLSENYYCNDNWDKFVTNDFISKLNLTLFSSELDDRILRKKLVTPLDMDILAAKIGFSDNMEQLFFIETIFEKYRKTQSALYVRDSMHHAYVRSYIDLGQTDRILEILALKYKYGIYLDNYTANILMDLFLKEKNYANSAQVAIEVMLQEFNDNQITLSLSLLSCLKYLNSIKGLNTSDDASLGEANKTDAKTEKMLVNFLRNPYFDDHFDIKNFEHLVGKTIYFSASNLKINSLLADSYRIYGLIYFEKYEKIVALLKEMSKNNKKILKFVLDELNEKIKKILPKSDDDKKKIDEILKDFNELDLISITSNENIDVEKVLDQEFKRIVDEQSKKDINDQIELFKKWSNEQQTELKTQIRNFLIEEKKKSILERLDYLEKQEEILTFFDNKDKIRISYFNKGFSKENPTDIPLKTEEAQFSQLFERHFKHYKKKNKPAKLLVKSNTKLLMEESLTKLYNSQKSENP